MPRKKQIQQELKNVEALKHCAEQFGLVGDLTRMKICWLLCKHRELAVGEIAKMLGVSISLVSHALKRLKTYKLVQTKRDRKYILYRLSRLPFTHILKKRFSQL